MRRHHASRQDRQTCRLRAEVAALSLDSATTLTTIETPAPQPVPYPQGHKQQTPPRRLGRRPTPKWECPLTRRSMLKATTSWCIRPSTLSASPLPLRAPRSPCGVRDNPYNYTQHPSCAREQVLEPTAISAGSPSIQHLRCFDISGCLLAASSPAHLLPLPWCLCIPNCMPTSAYRGGKLPSLPLFLSLVRHPRLSDRRLSADGLTLARSSSRLVHYLS